MKRLIYLFVALFLIVFEAVPEGLALGGHKTIAGVFEFVFLAGITLTVFGFFTKQCTCFKWITYNENYWYLVIGYVLLRFALFDIVYNISAVQPVFFIGTTKLFDIIMTKLGAFVWVLKLLAFVWGTAWLLEWQFGIKLKR